jgi:Cdc6-like AAA superfamily ATPase
VAALVSGCGCQSKTLQNQEAMSLVPHKYTPAEMPADELEATFAAREHTVDYLLKSLRDQIHSGTLSSFVITGPRGAGKSTIIQMVALRIRQDAKLSAAWIPVVFPEEQFNMISLRDMLAAILHALGKQQISAAQEWLEKVEAEPNEEQSQQLAITGLREIVRQTGKRLILFIENLDQLLEEHLDDQMKGTLRRLLMTEPCMMIIGSTVHVFDSLKSYDKAFFNYFGQVPLDRLNPDQVSELLRKRAEFDHNEIFLRELPRQQAKVRTLVHLTGGNPRFVLMLYELLSLQKVTSIVQYLRRLVDELTPLLKDEMENLPPQQRKIIHALMEKGGTAQPTDLAGPTRLPLNAITAQLKRLKDAQIVEVLGGGKGRAANYTVPDKLFSIWYQMRYLSQNRRRIEMFVEVLRIWFEEEERVQTLRSLAEKSHADAPQMLREYVTTAEYFAASLKGTAHEHLAADLCIGSWVKADLQEAENILIKFAAALNLLKYEQAREIALRFLNSLASSPMKNAWPAAWRSLVTNLKPEAAEALQFLEPVYNVLEGKDRSLLDALPPEQREFAVEVLAKFNPQPKSKPVEYRKKNKSIKNPRGSLKGTKAMEVFRAERKREREP